jgi:hypothetical protein
MDAPHVWVAKDDGTDIVRADAIVSVGIDYNGNVTAQLAGSEELTVTLVVPGHQDGQHTPDDFHRQLIRALAQLSDAAGAFLLRPVCDEQHGWHWISGPL